MAESGPLDKLGYILHLLEDLNYFHHTNTHVCSCEICDKKTSLVRSSITTAIEEVKDISSSLRCSPLLNSPRNSHAAEAGVKFSSPTHGTNISNSPTSNESVKYSLGHKSPVRSEEIERHLAPFAQQYSNNAFYSSLLNSTQRDSGVHTENFLLNSNSISPIRGSDRHDTSNESSNSDRHYKKTHEYSTASYNSQVRHFPTKPTDIRTSQSYNEGAAYPQSNFPPLDKGFMLSQTLPWPNILPVHHNAHQVYPFVKWAEPSHYASTFKPYVHPSLPLTNVQYFPFPHPQLIQPSSTASFENHSFGNTSHNSMHMKDQQSNELSEQRGEVLNCTQVNASHRQKQENIAFGGKSSHQFKNPRLPQIIEKQDFENDMSTFAKPVLLQEPHEHILRKDVMLNEARNVSINSTHEKTTLFGNSNTSPIDIKSESVDLKDISGAMWRPWEAKEDVYKIISDSSIKEEDSAEERSVTQVDSFTNEPVELKLSQASNEEMSLQSEGNIQKDVEFDSEPNKQLPLSSSQTDITPNAPYLREIKDNLNFQEEASQSVQNIPEIVPEILESPHKGKSFRKNKKRLQKTSSWKENLPNKDSRHLNNSNIKQSASLFSLQDISNRLKQDGPEEIKVIASQNAFDNKILEKIDLTQTNFVYCETKFHSQNQHCTLEDCLMSPIIKDENDIVVPVSLISSDQNWLEKINSESIGNTIAHELSQIEPVSRLSNGTKFPAMGMHQKITSLNSSVEHGNESCEQVTRKKIQTELLSSEDHTVKESNFCTPVKNLDSLAQPSESDFTQLSSVSNDMPKDIPWGAPAVDYAVGNFNYQPIVSDEGKKEYSSNTQVLEIPSNKLKQDVTDSSKTISSSKSSDTLITISQTKDEINPTQLNEFENKMETVVLYSKQKSTDSMNMDRRSKITALCHDLLKAKTNQELDKLNHSLPIAKTSYFARLNQPESDEIGSSSFEANQSYPKMGQAKEDISCATFGTKICKTTDWDSASTPLKTDGVTPRNRHSIFGLSPPEVSGLQNSYCQNNNNEKELVSSLKRLKSSSHSTCNADEDHPIYALDRLWEALDLSERFVKLPTIKEILFNCVTGSICLVDPSRKSKIISVNESFQMMIGLHEKVVGQKLCRFIKIPDAIENMGVSIPHNIIQSDGSTTSVCGRRVTCVISSGEEIPVFIWTVHLQSNSDLMACMINVAPALVGTYFVDESFEFITEEESKALSCLDGYKLIPCTCGVITGLIVLQSDGSIIDYDYSFFQLLLGYGHLNKHHISDLLVQIVKTSKESKNEKFKEDDLISPFEVHSCLAFGLGDVDTLMEFESEEDIATESDSLLLPASCFSEQEVESLSQPLDPESDNKCNRVEKSDKLHLDFNDSCGNESFLISASVPQTSTPCKGNKGEATKTSSMNESVKMTNGIYSASLFRGNGCFIDISFKMSSIQTAKMGRLFCLWVYVQQEDTSTEVDSDEESDDEDSPDEIDLTTEKLNHLHLHSKDPVEEASLGQVVTEQAILNHSHNATHEDVHDLELGIGGSFAKKYITLDSLGQGSFGFVRRAKPICGEPKSVVVKFIRIKNMFSDGWTQDGDEKVPSEVAILRSLDNENIIKVLDVHQNGEFVQMVMEDFGDLDLFDFIDQVDIDEPLSCFIFRQIISGIDYLHSCRILHRDIKDENVIINSSLHCKLIDFGSAAYMLPPGMRFDKFRGTLEYCSPEVHLGQGYRGPELDAWALGVTLFTMVFRENPYTAESVPQQMKNDDFPFSVSQDLSTLLLGLMCCDPHKRFSIKKALGCEWLRQIVNISKYKWEDLLGSATDV